jgi:hypothetical protein
MKYKITKLDRRHNGWNRFKYLIMPYDNSIGIEPLNQARNWLWATYGPSCELSYSKLGDLWAWDTEYSRKRIYLKSDEELALFALKFAS